MFRSQTDKHCAQCLRTSCTRGALLFQGMEQTVKKSTEQHVEGTGVNQNQLMSLSADLRLLFQSKSIIVIREEN